MKILKKNINLFIGIIIGIILTSTSVYAAIIYQSSQVGYDNSISGLSSTNVQSALDELYNKYSEMATIKVGDYLYMVPDLTSYTISTSTTGHTAAQTINPSELTLWRVIGFKENGQIEAVSDYVSSKTIYFDNIIGYANFIGGLNTIAQQYKKSGVTSSVRMIGYNGQTLTISNTSSFNGSTTTPPSTTTTSSPTSGTGQEYSGGVLGDTLYLKDYLLVKNVYGNLISYKVGTSTVSSYWLSSRMYDYSSANYYSFKGRFINQSGSLDYMVLRYYYNVDGWSSYQNKYFAVRPIITVNSGVPIKGGNGTKSNPYKIG